MYFLLTDSIYLYLLLKLNKKVKISFFIKITTFNQKKHKWFLQIFTEVKNIRDKVKVINPKYSRQNRF